MSVFQMIRGILANLPALAAGQPALTTDQVRFYVGSASGNRLLGVLDKVDGAAAPTVNEDAGDGYSPGSQWTDTTNDKAYQCVDATTGAAVWQQFSGTGTGGITQLTGHVTAGPGTGSQVATIANTVITDAMVVAANKDGAAGTPSMRTLGTGAAQAAAGNDARLSDSRAPSGAAGGDLAGTYPNPTLAGSAVFPNVLCNACFVVAQRGTSYAAPTDLVTTLDRWIYGVQGAGVNTVSQSTDVPTVAQAGGMTHFSIKLDVTTADATLAAGDRYFIGQYVEGYDFARFIGQEDFSLSFWVKSTKTGTFCVSVSNSGQDRILVKEYTVTTTDTWEYKTVTFTASPSAGTWNYTSGIGIRLVWTIAAGSAFQATADAWQSDLGLGVGITSNQVNGMDNTANNFLLARPMLSLGSSAKSLVPVPVDADLARCLRYMWTVAGLPLGRSAANNALYNNGSSVFSTPMRDVPTLLAGATFNVSAGSAGTPALGSTTAQALSCFNSAANWTTNVNVSLNATLYAELS